MNAAEMILMSVCGVVALPVLVVSVEVCAAVCEVALTRLSSSLRPQSVSPSCNRPRVAVIIPAHNEQAGIAQTIASIQRQLAAGDRTLVVADNCTDHTAAVARAAGAEVIERQSDTEKGKGFALAAGVDALRDDPPAIVLVVDADMSLADASVTALTRVCSSSGRPAQSVDLLTAATGASPAKQLSVFAFALKNLVRAAGAQALSMPCLLRGTGMAFPWGIISHAKLATGNIVEDMQLGIDLAVGGYPPAFCPAARVTGELPSADSAATTQRTRWEHGHLRTILHNCPPLLWHGVRQMRPSLIALSLDLAVPPLALLACMWVALLCLTAVSAAIGISSYWPVLIAMAIGGVFLAVILLAWAVFARRIVPLTSLLSIPWYIILKIPLYFAFLVRPQRAWVRTSRG